MKKLLILVSFLFIANVYSQSNRFGTISAGVGANIGIHIVGLQAANITSYATENYGVIIGSTPIDLNFGLVKPLSIGFQYAPTKVYLGNLATGNCSAMGLNANLYMINKKRFNMAFGFTYGLMQFKPISYTYDVNNKMELKLKGNVVKGRLLFNFYFSDNAGMYLALGYSSYQAKLDEYTILLQDQQLEDELNNLAANDFTLITRGADISIGIAIKFDVMKPRKELAK